MRTPSRARLGGRGLLAGGAGVALLAALVAGAAGAAAAGALAVVGAAALALVALRAGPAGGHAGPGPLALERHALGRDVGLALVAAGPGRRLLVGFGPAGVTLLAELPPGDGAAPRERAP